MKKIVTSISLYEFIVQCLEPSGWSWGSSYPINFHYLWRKLGYEYSWLNPQICSNSPFNRYFYYIDRKELEKHKDELNRNLWLEWHIFGNINKISTLDGEE